MNPPAKFHHSGRDLRVDGGVVMASENVICRLRARAALRDLYYSNNRTTDETDDQSRANFGEPQV
jgi:hypothetical protein